jgi:lipoprotein-anchoring transpeptidase ErfK/SrfK
VFAVIGLLGLLVATATGGSPALSETGAQPAPRVQELAALLSPHAARRAPSRDSTSLLIVASRRPITEEQTVLPVVAHATNPGGRRWLLVRLPGRPNGRTGWIEGAGTVRRETSWHIVVELARRRVVVYLQAKMIATFAAVVGQPSTPTPQGEFFVEEAIQLSSGDVGGPFALALSARSDVLHEFEGGPGQVAIHGLAHLGGVPGTAVSHGCVRLSAIAMSWLTARIGPGDPVTIRS